MRTVLGSQVPVFCLLSYPLHTVRDVPFRDATLCYVTLIGDKVNCTSAFRSRRIDSIRLLRHRLASFAVRVDRSGGLLYCFDRDIENYPD